MSDDTIAILRWPAELLPQLYWLIPDHYYPVFSLQDGYPVPSRIDPTISIQIDRKRVRAKGSASE